MARDDFSEETKRRLGERVNLICSNPECRVQTKGPHTDDSKAASVGKACHVHAASPGGPRYDENQTPEERSSIQNGIWLCSNCATLIDNDEQRFPAELLRAWKAGAERRARDAMGTSLVDAATEASPGQSTTEFFVFELERLRDAAHERGTAACGGPWTALIGATYDGAQLKHHLHDVIELLARDPSARTLLRELLHLVDVANATAASVPPGAAPNQLQLQDLRRRSAEAAQKIHLKTTQLLGYVAPRAAAAETPAFVVMLEDQEHRTRYMQEVFHRMNHGPKVTFQSGQETRKAGVPYRVNFNGRSYEAPELLQLFEHVVTEASSSDDEFAFWGLLNATRNLRRATWDLMNDWPSCPWSKEEWLPLAERFAELEQEHGEGGDRFWDEFDGVGVEDGEFFHVGAKYAPAGVGPARLAADAKRRRDLAATLHYAQMALDSDAYAVTERAAGRAPKRDNVHGNAWSGFVQQVTGGRLQGW